MLVVVLVLMVLIRVLMVELAGGGDGGGGGARGGVGSGGDHPQDIPDDALAQYFATARPALDLDSTVPEDRQLEINRHMHMYACSNFNFCKRVNE